MSKEGSPSRVVGRGPCVMERLPTTSPVTSALSPSSPGMAWAQLHPRREGGTLWQHVGCRGGGGRPWVRAALRVLWLGLPVTPIPADGGEALLGCPTHPSDPALAFSRLRFGPRCSLQQDRGGQRRSTGRVAMASEPVVAAKAALVRSCGDRRAVAALGCPLLRHVSVGDWRRAQTPPSLPFLFPIPPHPPSPTAESCPGRARARVLAGVGALLRRPHKG